jgi:hypothetical protein
VYPIFSYAYPNSNKKNIAIPHHLIYCLPNQRGTVRSLTLPNIIVIDIPNDSRSGNIEYKFISSIKVSVANPDNISKTNIVLF